jgi:hypothetical protein
MQKIVNAYTIPGSISLIDETLIPIRFAGGEFPVPVSPAKIERMWREGARGVRLETMLVGNRRYTSKEAIRRFLENSQNNQEAVVSQTSNQLPPPGMTDTEIEAARAKYKLPPSGGQ